MMPISSVAKSHSFAVTGPASLRGFRKHFSYFVRDVFGMVRFSDKVKIALAGKSLLYTSILPEVTMIFTRGQRLRA
jgi:hypothetical protein